MKKILFCLILFLPACVCMTKHDYQIDRQLAVLEGKGQAHVEDLRIIEQEKLSQEERISLIQGRSTLDEMAILSLSNFNECSDEYLDRISRYEAAAQKAADETNKQFGITKEELKEKMQAIMDLLK